MLEELDKKELIQMIQKLEQENKELKEKIYGKQEEKEISKPIETKVISNEDKLKIFMQVFKGRTDLYAKRWTSNKTGKSGYSPVCKNEFSTYKCDKPRVKCNECAYRELIPLTEDIILKHLKGEITVGIYPLLHGDLCNFLVIDFDKKTYEKDVIAFWNTCDELNIPLYVERSRSGNGAHAWIFFEESISARMARKMGNILLTKTMEKQSLDLNSYDRLLPNQDTMPKGGFGNLIALPFQGECSKNGNTVFVNKYFEVEKNQLEILSNIKRMTNDEIYDFVEKYKEDDYKEPQSEEFSDDEIPQEENLKDIIFINNVDCILDKQIYIKKLKLLPNEITYLKRLASFTNPKFYELQKLRMPIFYKTTPRIISCFEEDERFLILPRGCLDKIKEVCEKSNVKLIIKDTREKGIETDYKFNGKLNKKQENAMEELLKHDTGVLCAATGFGKTVVGAKIISELKTNTLVIVNRNNLLEQWKERLSYFLDINKKDIGQIGASKENPNGKLDVASFQSLFKKDNVEELIKGYGLVIVDECHHVAAFSFENVLKSIKSKNVYGLTATPTRKDGWHKIIYMQCGDIRVRVSNKQLKQNKKMEHTVVVKKTNYKYIALEEKDKIQISEILNDMCNNVFRNSMIIEDIKNCVQQGRVPIVLTERIQHLKILKESLEELNVPVVIYKGNMGKKKTKEVQEIINEADDNNKPRIILATSSSIGEGFDDNRLDTLFLTMPVSWKGRIIQYVGRLHREHEDKEKVIVYDYLDNMKVLEKMYSRRLKGYKIAGYEVVE
ncbi:MAG: DEAD/DEAH box helicase [Clostridia bacterium]|nr:DEAD/DEAH box helicase [Clostridia bacterium]